MFDVNKNVRENDCQYEYSTRRIPYQYVNQLNKNLNSRKKNISFSYDFSTDSIRLCIQKPRQPLLQELKQE